jgi:predicted phosphodiesterase/ribosomal protein L30/L7E
MEGMTSSEDGSPVKDERRQHAARDGATRARGPAGRSPRQRLIGRLLRLRATGAHVVRVVAGRGTRGRAVLRWLGRLALVIILAVGGIALGLRAAGATTNQTSLGVISLRVEPAWQGEVEAFIPIVDWGVRAHAFSAPIRLHVEPRSANRGALLSAASGKRSVLGQAERDARAAARGALVRAVLWAIGGALVFAMGASLIVLAWRRSVRRAVGWLVAPPVLTAALSVAVLLRLDGTFNASAFQTPRFYANGAELAQLLNVADHAQAESKGYTSSVYRALEGYSTLLSAAGNLANPATRQLPAVLISDLHDNELALAAVRDLVSGSPIFFPGDFGQYGSTAETRSLIPKITALGQPIIAVSGNHDSRLFMRALAKAGVIVLTNHGRLEANGSTDGKPVQRVDELKIAGYPDPLEWPGPDPTNPDRIFSFAQLPDGNRKYGQAQTALISWFEQLTPRPQVVLVHENGLAQSLARAVATQADKRPLLILTGHDHKQHIDRYGNILVVDAGTVGAGGIFGIGQEQVGMAELHLPAGQATPRAVDLIQVQPFTGAATAERVVPSSQAFCERQHVDCHPPELTG